jgi:ATP phosphoribosyltransferase
VTDASARLRIAVQKSGRLAEPSLALLRRAGLVFRASRDHLFLHGENLPVDVLLVRDDDIPDLLVEGSCELGIVGRNVLRERCPVAHAAAPIEESLVLGFGACRLSIAIPLASSIASLDDLAGQRIATSYPRLLAHWLQVQGIAAEVVVLNGSVEIAPRLGKAEAICDLVSSGATLAANQLCELATVLASEAVLAVNPRNANGAKAILIERMRSRIAGAQSGDGVRLLMLQAPRTALPEITRVLPAHDRPSVTSIDGRPEDIAMQALCSEALDWQHLEELKRLGAHGLMVLNVEQMLA